MSDLTAMGWSVLGIPKLAAAFHATGCWMGCWDSARMIMKIELWSGSFPKFPICFAPASFGRCQNTSSEELQAMLISCQTAKTLASYIFRARVSPQDLELLFGTCCPSPIDLTSFMKGCLFCQQLVAALVLGLKLRISTSLPSQTPTHLPLPVTSRPHPWNRQRLSEQLQPSEAFHLAYSWYGVVWK